jgi:hypothetical protein
MMPPGTAAEDGDVLARWLRCSMDVDDQLIKSPHNIKGSTAYQFSHAGDSIAIDSSHSTHVRPSDGQIIRPAPRGDMVSHPLTTELDHLVHRLSAIELR